ncbi:MAG: hybrid sensor histidine kinase/response regulator [Bradymonadales bacterium]|nr:hybrid sensor histidine kinase/response regulator [Bradymonadales bacterium]
MSQRFHSTQKMSSVREDPVTAADGSLRGAGNPELGGFESAEPISEADEATVREQACLPLLIVDDEPDVLDSLRRLLRKDYRLHLALSAKEALRIMERNEIALVMSDQRMPDMTGVEFLTLVRLRYPRAVRMLFTGYGGDVNAVVEAINQGHVYRYIHKPFEPAELKVIVAQAGERYLMQAEKERLTRELEARNILLDRQNQELAEVNEQLKTHDRLRNIAIELLGHELNTPAAVILGYSMLLRKGTIQHDSPIYETAMEGIESSGRRLKGIADKLARLLLGEAAAFKPLHKSIEAREILDEIIGELQPVLTMRNQTIQVEEKTETLELEADEGLLHDILINLVINAIKFSPDGSTIWVEIGEADLRGVPAVEFAVRDQGVGIQSEDREQIFTTFFGTFRSTHHSSGEFGFEKRGLGLGLAIVKRFTELHHGSVEFESEPGQGSVFRVKLPCEQTVGTEPS